VSYTNAGTEETWTEELVETTDAAPQGSFLDIDANGDGTIDRGEWEFYMLDANKDGAIDFDEFQMHLEKSMTVEEMNASINAMQPHVSHKEAVETAVAGKGSTDFKAVGGARSSTAVRMSVGGLHLFVKKMSKMKTDTPSGVRQQMVYRKGGLEVAEHETTIQMMAAQHNPPLAPAVYDFWAAAVEVRPQSSRTTKVVLVAMEDLGQQGYKSLRDLLKPEAGLLAPDLAAVLSKSIKGLGDLHAMGIEHGDAHPGNVMVLATGPSAWKVLWIDFGKSKTLPKGTPMPDTDETRFKGDVKTEMAALYAKLTPAEKTAMHAAVDAVLK